MKSWTTVKLGHVDISLNIAEITRLASRESHQFIISPNAHTKITKYKVKLLLPPIYHYFVPI